MTLDIKSPGLECTCYDGGSPHLIQTYGRVTSTETSYSHLLGRRHRRRQPRLRRPAYSKPAVSRCVSFEAFARDLYFSAGDEADRDNSAS